MMNNEDKKNPHTSETHLGCGSVHPGKSWMSSMGNIPAVVSTGTSYSRDVFCDDIGNGNEGVN